MYDISTASQSGLYPSHTLLSSLTDLLRTSGIRGLFQGFTATALRDAPYAGVSVVFYEKGKDVLSELMGTSCEAYTPFIVLGFVRCENIVEADCVWLR